MGKRSKSKCHDRRAALKVVEPPPEIAAITDRITGEDRTRFEMRTEADVCDRPPNDGEFWPQNLDPSHGLVYQIRPGYRMRLPLVRLILLGSERGQ